MNRFFLSRAAWVIAAAGLAGVVAVKQNQRLMAVRADIERLKAGAPVQKAPASRRSKADVRSKGVSPEELSLAGEEDLPDARALIGRVTARWLESEDCRTRPGDLEEDIDHLEELLAGMGAGTARRLRDELAGARAGERVLKNFRSLYAQLNPSQSLAWTMTDPAAKEREWAAAADFSAWLHFDRTAAMAWFREKQGQGDPIADSFRLLDGFVNAQANIDPVAAVAGIGKLMIDHPGLLRAERNSVLGFRADADPGPRVALVAECNAALTQPDVGDLTRKVCEMTVKGLTEEIVTEPFGDVATVIDVFLPGQKWELALRVASNRSTAEQERGKWAQWMATLEPPQGQGHPVIGMAMRDADSSNFREPAWLLEVPPGPLRDQAVTQYIDVAVYSHPEIAARWLAQLPSEEARQYAYERAVQTLPDQDDPQDLKARFVKAAAAGEEEPPTK